MCGLVLCLYSRRIEHSGQIQLKSLPERGMDCGGGCHLLAGNIWITPVDECAPEQHSWSDPETT